MADKNKAAGLVTNLGIGKKNEPKQEVAAPLEVARPSVESGCKEGDARTTIILNKELVKKVKFIALSEGTTIKDKVTEGLTAIVKAWEDEKGEINV